MGVILASVLVFSALATIVSSALITWAGISTRVARSYLYKEQAIHIAEAGIDYYRWHLAHAPQDYTDATSTPGPYTHVYYDKDNVRVGTFALTITPPPLGSTLVTVESKGVVDSATGTPRTVRAQFAKPSIAKYAVVANDNMRFGAGTEIYGPLHANGGIHFDGVAYNTVTSAKTSYVDPDYGGSARYGVYTLVSPADGYPPTAVPTRLDVFKAGRQFPVPQVDFSGITADVSSMKTSAQTSGRYIAPSGAQGYHLVFKTDDTFDLYKVTNLATVTSQCSSNSNGSTGWGSWSIKSSGGQTFVANYANPVNGIIFVEDNVWVDGQINTARITVVAAKFPVPTTPPSITINTNLLYTTYDGQDVMGLIAQGDVNVGLNSDDDLRIDAALVAQNGRVGRYYYASACTNYKRNSLTLNGMIATNKRYGFAYTDGTGYQTRTIAYDANLLYSPPPSFPLTTDQYAMVSWQEVK